MGRATAAALTARGYQVFGSVRKPADAAEVQAQLGERFTPLLFDVTDEDAVRAAAEQTASQLAGQGLAGLVNNAGMSINGPLMHIPLDQLRRQYDVNVVGLIGVTQAFLPLLGAQLPQPFPPGRIINISSLGGRIALPFLGPYTSSKHAVEGLSDSLRRELLIYGIDVIVVEPGSVRTAIWDKAETEDFSEYKDTHYYDLLQGYKKQMLAMGRAGVEPEVVGKLICTILERKRPKTRYPLPDNPIFGWLLLRILPDRWLDRLIGSRAGLTRKT
jgi:NAD(P)-dependent dehydrogenase (short-subunit alcohol dehydrogenase family)